MDRRTFLKTVASGCVFTAVAGPSVLEGSVKKKPNLLFVMADQFRNHSLGFMGQDPVITPNFDRMAKEGQYLTNAISSYPVCTPFRAMMVTGRFPVSTGMTFNCLEGLGMELRRGEYCIGDVLKEKGYRTGYIGKWHLEMPSKNLSENPKDKPTEGSDAWTPPGPRRHGFDFWYAYNTGRAHFNPNYWTGDSPEKIVKKNTWSVEHETDVAIDFIKKGGKKQDRPFALFVSWNPPHPPYVAPRDKASLYDEDKIKFRPNVKEDTVKNLNLVQRNYFAAVTSCDENFGRLLNTLDEQGLSENTIVVFTSDHGEMLGSQGMMQKDIWYEEAINIPFLIRWPDRIKRGENDMLMGPFDMMPTLLGLMGFEPPESCQGDDMSEALSNGVDFNRESVPLMGCPCDGSKYWEMANPVPWVKNGRHLFMKGYDWRELGYRAVRTKRYTYVVDRSLNIKGHKFSFDAYGTRNTEKVKKLPDYAGPKSIKTRRYLYDNLKDPYQINPVMAKTAENNEMMMELEKQLQYWLDRMNDTFPLV